VLELLMTVDQTLTSQSVQPQAGVPMVAWIGLGVLCVIAAVMLYQVDGGLDPATPAGCGGCGASKAGVVK